MPGSVSHGEFDFDLAGAVIDQLVEAFAKLDIGRLERTVLLSVDAGHGIYELYLGRELVYVGCAVELRNRLLQHHDKLSGRKNLHLETMGFKCLSVDQAWVQVTHEKQLIEHHTGCAWNKSGFGNHDYGRDRDTTRPSRFDESYPIYELWSCDTVGAGKREANSLLRAIKAALPYTFRYETDQPQGGSTKGSTKYNGLEVHVPRPAMPAQELLREVVNQFPPGWQATFFPGHVILYEEDRRYADSVVELRRL